MPNSTWPHVFIRVNIVNVHVHGTTIFLMNMRRRAWRSFALQTPHRRCIYIDYVRLYRRGIASRWWIVGCMCNVHLYAFVCVGCSLYMQYLYERISSLCEDAYNIHIIRFKNDVITREA